MNRYDVIRAVFRPLRTDDLQPGVADWIGREVEVMASGIVDHDCPYTGDWSMTPTLKSREFPAVWIPLCDLEVLSTEEPKG